MCGHAHSYGGKPSLDAVTGIALSCGMPRAGSLRTSNALVNTLMDNVHRTMRANFMAVPTDCPQRDERLGWLDGQVM
jgi:alpha-L-rhamnosidase